MYELDVLLRGEAAEGGAAAQYCANRSLDAAWAVGGAVNKAPVTTKVRIGYRGFQSWIRHSSLLM